MVKDAVMSNSPRKILLVEDEDAILFAFKKVLSAPTLIVDTAQSLEEAVVQLHHNEYRAVIADLRLSNATAIEGFEVIKQAKKKQGHCTIIVLTAYGKSDTREHVFTLGADYYLEKPVSPHKIKDILKSLEIIPN